MNLGRLLVLGVAIGAGLIAAFIAMNLVRQPPAPAPAPAVAEGPAPPPATQVLVAAADIPIGTRIASGNLQWHDWPASGVSDRFVTRVEGTDQIEQLTGSIARATIFAGEPITDSKLIRSDQGYMAAILPPGMRAIATRISVETGAGGFILPNDRVDLVMVRRMETAVGRADAVGTDIETEVILSNIRVLAIDQTIEEQDGQKVVVGQTATLELTPRQVQILAAAQPMADRLVLALRSIADSQVQPSDQESDAVHLIDGSRREGIVTIVRSGVARDVSGIR